MAGRGPAPKPQRFRRKTPERGEWQPSPDGGWQHELPDVPKDLSPAAEAMWTHWFTAWWAGHWTEDDVPMLRFAIRLYDRVLRGDTKLLGELRQWCDAFGITPKGQQDRRWTRPEPPRRPDKLDRYLTPSRYRDLRVTDDEPRAIRDRFTDIEAR
jgi:hypothetical protein